ncbi:MAG: Flp pilus assembly protein CpaB [Planctomycetes bacterium]|nr:Flp pilus assembly protein CpaB [Planctomycetota bacterium]
MSTRIALALSIVLAIIAAVGVRAWIEDEKQKEELKHRKVPILIARSTLKANTILKDNMFNGTWVARDLVTADMIHYDERRRFVNKILRKAVPGGEAILRDYITDEANKSTAGKQILQDGMRAIAIRVNQDKSAGFLIRPGDYIDIMGTFDIKDAAQGGARGASSATTAKTICLIENVKVISVDNRTEEYTSRVSKIRTDPYRTITLEVKPKDGAKLINAQQEGDLYFMLRPRDGDTSEVLKSGTQYRWDDK